jgi:hypothetical protein
VSCNVRAVDPSGNLISMHDTNVSSLFSLLRSRPNLVGAEYPGSLNLPISAQCCAWPGRIVNKLPGPEDKP